MKSRTITHVAIMGVGLLLCTSAGWSQSFTDSILGFAANGCTAKSYSVGGTAANDYQVDGSVSVPFCKRGAASSRAHASLGHGLAIFGATISSGLTGQAAAGPLAKDTVLLATPPGFTGNAVIVHFTDSYQFSVNKLNAKTVVQACWQLGSMPEFCHSQRSNGSTSQTLTLKITVNRTSIGFELPVRIRGEAAGAQGTSTLLSVGTPQLTLPVGWKFTWASGE